jgi:uncharacterized protein
MSSFRTGHFERAKLNPLIRPLCPIRAVESILEVDPADLAARGKKLILLDVDNTLLVWKQESIPQTSIDWLARCRENNLELMLISNTRHPDRLHRLSEALKIEYVRGKFKPSRDMYQKALEKFEVTADQAIMIGDQMFTDVLGANRASIEAVWVRQMAPKDFIGTKVSRMGEKIVRRKLYKVIRTEAAPGEEMLGSAAAFELLKHSTVRQFVKFVLIGATSTAIDFGLWFALMFFVPWGDQTVGRALGQALIELWPAVFSNLSVKADGTKEIALAAGPVIRVLTTGLAILNSFILNRRFTFKVTGAEERGRQLRKFYTIALIGMGLTLVITTILSDVIPGHPKRSAAVASLIAMVIVAFWNFFGQKLWTFRGHEKH